MRKILLTLVVAIFILLHGTCSAGLNDYPRVAVLETTNDSMVADINVNDTKSVTNYVIEALLDSGRFNVMERSQLQALAREHHLNMTGLIDVASAPQIGKMLGVEYLIISNIASISNKEGVVGYEHSTYGGASNNQHQVIANITARIVEVQTGRIVMAAHGSGRSTSTNTEISFNRRKHDRHQTTATDPLTGLEDVEDADSISTTTHTIKLGSETFSSVQVHNALYKAVIDTVDGKFGFVTKLDGRGKKMKK